MCGICGVFHFNGEPVSKEAVTRMSQAMTHRGPDGSGHFFDGEVGLGHRRLSIIDLERGGQPLSNEDNTIQIVFNGEVYNYIELRQQLIAHGHRFKTDSDTEVIIHAYEQWGADCVNRFNGMFAFALWNTRTRTLFLARDHLGIKPLYYFRSPTRLLFASEIKALLNHPECPRGVDHDRILELFTFRYVPAPGTLFDGIHKLPPACHLTVSSTRFELVNFWQGGPPAEAKENEGALIEEYQALLEDAVRLQMRSDVPVGLFLSSGVDSSVLLALMRQFTNAPIKTFTIGFAGGEKTNEISYAAALSRHFGAEHTAQLLEPSDYAGYYQRYMYDIEEPVGNETAAAFYFVSKLASKEVKVALSGQGADEPWAGYPRHRGAMYSDYYSRLPKRATAALAAIANHLPGRWERLQRATEALRERDPLRRMVSIYSFFNNDMKERLFAGPLGERYRRDPDKAGRTLAPLFEQTKGRSTLSQILWMDTRSSLPDDLLMVGDKTSMACSIESRVPLLDYRLVEFAERLPDSLKLNLRANKYLHRKACAKWLPADVATRPKKGFVNPVDQWMRKEFVPLINDYLFSTNSFASQIFDTQYLKRMIHLDRTGKRQLKRHIYLILSLEMWHRAFLG